MASLLSLMSLVNAHMEMVSPAPRRSKHHPYYAQKHDIDYDMTTPLGSSAGYNYPFPCRTKKSELENDFPTFGSYKAGSKISVELGGGAPHEGGHCEFSLSYDHGNTFVVLKTLIGSCMVNGERNYTVHLPDTTPAGKAVFAWTWINRVGNREFYMNCADIEIKNDSGAENWHISGPQPFVGNLPGHPTVPSFHSSDYVTGSEHYKNRKTITVSPSKAPTNPPTKPVPAPIKPVPAPIPAPIKPVPSPILPSPVPIKPTPGRCSNGEMKCKGLDGFLTCSNGVWIFRKCQNKSTCKTFGKGVMCFKN